MYSFLLAADMSEVLSTGDRITRKRDGPEVYNDLINGFRSHNLVLKRFDITGKSGMKDARDGTGFQFRIAC